MIQRGGVTKYFAMNKNENKTLNLRDVLKQYMKTNYNK